MKNHKSLIVNRKSIPFQYQKGYVEFFKLKFKVTPDVLIPRPETELLVDEVLHFVSQRQTTNCKIPTTIVDIGTGAGNIAISLAKHLSHLGGVKIIATDISKKALKVAKQNAKLHSVEKKIKFIKSDLLTAFCHSERSEESLNLFDKEITRGDNLIIVANLPYIPSERIPYLDSSVKDFEPNIALDGGQDGFELYRKLFKQIKKLHRQPKMMVFEIDYTHGDLAYKEAQIYFPEANIEIKLDLHHRQRILRVKF